VPPAAFPALRPYCVSLPKVRAGSASASAPTARAGARRHQILDPVGNPVGQVTSGGFGPSIGAPIAMGYVDASRAAEGSALALVVRDVPGRRMSRRCRSSRPAITAADSMKYEPTHVIPAKAGIQERPGLARFPWTPAFAGVTATDRSGGMR